MKISVSGLFFLMFALLLPSSLKAQYPPPAGKPGTTAMHLDSSAFIGWASSCSINRGYINMVDTTVLYNGVNKAAYGSYLYASGPADGLVVSLGDRGSALLTFDIAIVNKMGPDFAIFENSFGDSFLELAFVEVSSDSSRFVRFPSVSLTSEIIQVETFDTIDATKINNLAGKYRLNYGTPFDLDDIMDSTGIDLSNITQIRLIDVGGCIKNTFATYDSQGHKINDPWPTPFDTGGFDLDAIGVIHNKAEGVPGPSRLNAIRIYPNPVADKLTFISPVSTGMTLKINDISGKSVITTEITGKEVVDLSQLAPGIYFAICILKDGTAITRKIIKL
ncbi:MAG: T9SS type A sorting domain-containing protein [Bacteroidota bacterium]